MGTGEGWKGNEHGEVGEPRMAALGFEGLVAGLPLGLGRGWVGPTVQLAELSARILQA